MYPWLRYADRFLRFFDVPDTVTTGWSRLVTISFIILVTAISGMFLQRAFAGASANDLWLDERNGIATRGASYVDLITGNMASQVSKAPLDYIIQKFFDQIGGARSLPSAISPTFFFIFKSLFFF